MGLFVRSANQSRLARLHYAGSRETVKKELHAGELTLLTVGGIVGSGLFLASGQAIREAGPAVVISYLVGAALMGLELGALAEMSAADPAQGSFLHHARLALGPGWAFVEGWIFWFSSVLNLAAEATAAAIFTRLWLPSVPVWVLSSGYAALVVGVNFLNVKGFGTVESAMSSIKILATIVFIGASLLAATGHLALHSGVPAGWLGHGGFFPHGIRGILAAMVLVMFSMAGTGVLGLAAPHAVNPERNIPRAIRQTVGIVYLLYVGSLLGITGLVAWNRVPVHTGSPFIAALHRLPWPLFADLFNVVILLAVLSAMNAGLFATDRVLTSLGRAGSAPAFVVRERAGRPWIANALTGGLVLLASLTAYLLPKTAYLYLVTATSFQAIFIWMIIVLTQIYYRPMLERDKPGSLKFRLPGYPFLSWLEIGLLGAVLATAPLAPHELAPLGLGVLVTLLFVAIHLLRSVGRNRTAADQS